MENRPGCMDPCPDPWRDGRLVAASRSRSAGQLRSLPGDCRSLVAPRLPGRPHGARRHLP